MEAFGMGANGIKYEMRLSWKYISKQGGYNNKRGRLRLWLGIERGSCDLSLVGLGCIPAVRLIDPTRACASNEALETKWD